MNNPVDYNRSQADRNLSLVRLILVQAVMKRIFILLIGTWMAMAVSAQQRCLGGDLSMLPSYEDAIVTRLVSR